MIMVEDNEDFVISCSKSDLGISGLNVVVIWSFYEKKPYDNNGEARN